MQKSSSYDDKTLFAEKNLITLYIITIYCL